MCRELSYLNHRVPATIQLLVLLQTDRVIDRMICGIIGISLAGAGILKLVDRSDLELFLGETGFTSPFIEWLACLTVLVELALGVLLIVRPAGAWLRYGTIYTLWIFGCVHVDRLIFGSETDCGCFGNPSANPILISVFVFLALASMGITSCNTCFARNSPGESDLGKLSLKLKGVARAASVASALALGGCFVTICFQLMMSNDYEASNGHLLSAFWTASI